MASATEEELGGLFELPERYIHESGLSRNGPPTTTNTDGNGQYNRKQHYQWNGRTKIYIEPST